MQATILYTSSFDVSRPDGPGVNEQQFVCSLARLFGERVVFVIPTPRGPVRGDFPFERCVLLPPADIRRPRSWLAHQWQKYRALQRTLRERRPRFVVIRPDVMPLLELWLARAAGAPYCIKNAHVSARATYERAGLRGPFFRISYRLLERLFRGAAVVDVVSEIHRRDLVAQLGLAPNRVLATDNAVDCSLFFPMDKRRARAELGLQDAFPIVGYVGNRTLERGGRELLEALPKLLESFPDARALIVEGDSASTGELRALAGRLGVADRVDLRGPVPLHEVPRHVAAMDVAVSFRDDDGSSELKVRQYLACGRPTVVSAKVNGFVEANSLGSLVDRNDAAAIAAAIGRWARAVQDENGAREVTARIADYARAHLDTDAVNGSRIARWLALAGVGAA